MVLSLPRKGPDIIARATPDFLYRCWDRAQAPSAVTIRPRHTAAQLPPGLFIELELKLFGVRASVRP